MARNSTLSGLAFLATAGLGVLFGASLVPRDASLSLQSDPLAPIPAMRSPARRALPQTIEVEGIVFVRIPAGSITVPVGQTVRTIHSPAPFWMARTEITQKTFAAVMGFNPSQTRGDGLPVTCVTQTEAEMFLLRLMERHPGHRLNLPTEEQWEFACRAGEVLPFAPAVGRREAFSEALTKALKGDEGLLVRQVRKLAWFATDGPQPVGKKSPNAFGLYDMHGNVWEWASAVNAPAGMGCLRGGAWTSPRMQDCAADARDLAPRNIRRDSVGFRAAVLAVVEVN